MSELKPCPFCGESKLLYSGGCGFRYDDDDNQIRLFRVHCRTCKGRTGLFESLDEAVEAWNRRTNSTTIQPSALSTNLAEVGTDCISRQAAIDALRMCYDTETITMDNGDEYIDYGDAVNEIEQLPPAQPERRCVNCGRTVNNGGWYEDGRTRCPIEEHYALPKDGYCHLWEKRKDWEDNYVKRAEEGEK